MRTTVGTFFVATILFSSPSMAEPHDLRGYRLGMTLKEFKAMPYPDPGKYAGLNALCTGDPTPPKTYGTAQLRVPSVMAKIGLIRCKHFAPQKLGVMVNNKEAPLNVANVETFTTFEFLPGKDNAPRLVRIVVGSNMMYWDQFWSGYTTKYGQPTSVENGVVRNNLGATFPKITATWQANESSITLEQRDGNLKTMKVVYLHKNLGRSLMDALNRTKGSAASKL